MLQSVFSVESYQFQLNYATIYVLTYLVLTCAGIESHIKFYLVIIKQKTFESSDEDQPQNDKHDHAIPFSFRNCYKIVMLIDLVRGSGWLRLCKCQNGVKFECSLLIDCNDIDRKVRK